MMTKSKIDTTERSESVSKPFLTTLELMAKDWPSPEWIIEGILPEQGICILAGNPGDGKTWVALHVALCVSIGTPVFDHFPTKATNVLIVDEESGERWLHERLRIMGYGGSPSVVYLSYSEFRTEKTDAVRRVIADCVKEEIGLVIIDSLRRIFDGDENDSRSVNHVFSLLREFTRAGISLLIIHHQNKSGYASEGRPSPAAMMRGSGDIGANVDTHFSVSKIREGHLLFRPGKNRHAPEGKDFRVVIFESKVPIFKYEGEGSEEDETVKNAVIKALKGQEGMLKGDLVRIVREMLPMSSERGVMRTLESLVSNHGLTLRSGGQYNKSLYYLDSDQEEGGA